ncbi:DUF3080 family protein [Halomonas heilongjiangensis]|uniref:DUF3080 domain-containing protein n=1 Tax=Halomonas heilongjiangensis TaxID=1387883 RepID=A0A2N7TT95_9GAMM|nr:DUF3080 family protein [Halomonas heilongjiangensis]PMR71424.1 DUF3080 domain-containing protein [Halomonas heilongjiangensis]PXX88695.1 hypothetical protein CR158_14160 [Halomonas heilongjiangensis]
MGDWNSPGIERRPRRWRALSLVAALLAGCGGSDGGESDVLLTDYQQRLAASLGLEAPPPGAPDNIGSFPDRRERLLEIPETRDGLLNVYALRECHITNLVAERNNQLGRVAPASQRWLYELELWRRLDACWNSEVPAALAESDRQRLAQLIETKAEQLPRVSWNALFDSSEWAGSFSRASSPLSPEETRPQDGQLAALAYLRDATLHQFDPDWQPDSATLEGHLKTLQARPFSAELLRTLLLAEQRLEEASDLLEQALERRCSRVTGFIDELHQAPEHQRLEAWLARLEETAGEWFDAIDALLEAQVEGPEAVTDYRRRWLSLEAPEAPLPAFDAARGRHAALRETLVHHCR